MYLRATIILVCILMCSTCGSPQEKTYRKLLETEVGGKVGFVDASCQFAIPPRYEQTLGFSEGLASVKIDGRWGYIDTLGEFAIPPRFTGAFPFFEGLASVQSEVSGSWAFIDKSGKVVIAPQFSFPLFFSDALVPAYGWRDGIGGIAFGYMDKTGIYVIDFRDRHNERVSLSEFSDGLAGVHFQALNDDGTLGKSTNGYIDKSGRLVIQMATDALANFHEGRAAFYRDGKWDYIDRQGKVAIRPQYQFAMDFSQARAPVKLGTLWGYIDEHGQLAIEPQFQKARLFRGLGSHNHGREGRLPEPVGAVCHTSTL
jgi:hypothetical protein